MTLPPTGTLPRVRPEREPLTVPEAIRVGQSAERALRYSESRGNGHCGGYLALSYQGTAVTSCLFLTSTDVDAILSLLLEREAAMLAAFNVETIL